MKLAKSFSMKTKKIQQMLNEANREYSIAVNELYRPAEDMVKFAVCLSVKDILANYLRAYLLYKDIEAPKKLSISQLLKQCKTMDIEFRDINLSPVICRAENGEVKEMYCLSEGRVKKCFEAAHSIREMVMKKIMTVN